MTPPTRFLVSLLLVIGMVGALTTTAGAASADRRAVDRRLQARIDALVGRDDGPPGAIAVVQRGGKLLVFRGGVANLVSGVRMHPWMHTRIASTAKAYSGGVALSLVDAGVMSLDDTVGDLLPWTNPDWHEVTLAQALHHTSGIPDFTDTEELVDDLIASPEVAPRPRHLLSYVAYDDLEFDPDTEYRYSNSDNIVVALMAKAATGTRYERLLRELVSDPLRLRGTSLPAGVEMPRPFMRGYQWAGTAPPEDVTTDVAAGWAWASGGIVSTPLDQNRFIRGYVGRALFDAAIRDAQFDFVEGGSEPTGPGLNQAGLAIFRYETRCGLVFGHTGNTFGFTQFFAANRSGRRSAAVTITRQVTQDRLPDLYRDVRAVFVRAVCSALA